MTEDEIPDVFGHWAHVLGATYARKWNYAIPAEDLVQVALLAAVLAFRSYDPAHGAQPKTWIKNKMKYAVMDELIDKLHLRRKVNSTGAEPFDDLSLALVEGLSKAANASFVENMTSMPEWPAVDARLNIDVALALLTPRYREVIERRYFRQESQLEVAAALGIGFSRVSQIEKTACAQMRTAFTKSVPAQRYLAAAA